MSLPVRKFDALIVGGGGAGLRAAVELAKGRVAGGGGFQIVSDSLAHRRRPGGN